MNFDWILLLKKPAIKDNLNIVQILGKYFLRNENSTQYSYNDLIFERYILKYLGVKGCYVCNLFSHSLAKKTSYILHLYIFKFNIHQLHRYRMLTCVELGIWFVYCTIPFRLFVIFKMIPYRLLGPTVWTLSPTPGIWVF